LPVVRLVASITNVQAAWRHSCCRKDCWSR
jgi:hypothetical protein